jgi:hypothetical protein
MLAGQDEKFDNFNIAIWNAHHNALKTRFEADNEPTQERLDAATTAEKAHAEKCREFRNWCSQKRDEIPRTLDNPPPEFSPAERAGWQELHEKIVKRLAELEVVCPIIDDPKPPPPGRKAIRTWG